MALSALDDLTAEPTDGQVAAALGPALGAWSELCRWLDRRGLVDSWQWGSSGRKYGWALRAKLGKRTIAYLIPQHGSFLVGLVLSDRALAAARATALSQPVIEVIDAARRYAEGTGFRLPVADTADLADIRRLVEIKARC